jgi:hypothetical protein
LPYLIARRNAGLPTGRATIRPRVLHEANDACAMHLAPASLILVDGRGDPMTTMLYHCPDCDRLHDEPADAAYALLVVCLNCALERDLAAVPQPSGRDLVAAA